MKRHKDAVREDFRGHIANLIERRGQSVRGVEEYSGMPHGSLSKFLAGERWISAANLQKLADYLRVAFQDLWAESRGDVTPPASPTMDSQTAEALGWAVIKALQQLPAETLQSVVGMLTEPAFQPTRQQKIVQRLSRAWEELPEEEQAALWEMIEERRMAKEPQQPVEES